MGFSDELESTDMICFSRHDLNMILNPRWPYTQCVEDFFPYLCPIPTDGIKGLCHNILLFVVLGVVLWAFLHGRKSIYPVSYILSHHKNIVVPLILMKPVPVLEGDTVYMSLILGLFCAVFCELVSGSERNIRKMCGREIQFPYESR